MESLITKRSDNTAHLVNKKLCKRANNVEGILIYRHKQNKSTVLTTISIKRELFSVQ